MQQCDLSIIIPVYNCEDYIKKCIDSILQQDYKDLRKIQVILVNDGSTDNSLEICNNLKNTIKDFSIDVITGKNEGVSKARNKGIKMAHGKYIMYIDADDFISKNTVKDLIAFFDEHYDELDLVTYSFYRYINETKKISKFDRCKIFSRGTDVYDLSDKDYNVLSPSMNIIVKNYYQDNVLFDTTMKYHEDTKYNIMIYMKKKKIGYVDEAKYMYRRHMAQETDIRSNAIYSFYDTMNLFDYCINNYSDEKGVLEKTLQSLILYEIRSKLLGKSQNLFPNFLDEKETENAKRKFVEVLHKVENSTIINDTNTDRYHKIYLLKLKESNFEVYTNHKNKFTINSDGDLVDIIDNVELVFTKFKVKNGIIDIFAYLRSPIFFINKPKVCIKYKDLEKNTIIEEIELEDTNADMYRTNIKVAKFYAFRYKVQSDKVKKFQFKVYLQDNDMKVSYRFGMWTPISTRNHTLIVYDGKYRIRHKGNNFLISIPGKKRRIKDTLNSIKKYMKIKPIANFYRIFSKTKEKIWLYNDRVGIFDNGYYQFKHDIKIKDGIKRYYALDGKFDKTKFSKEEAKNVIKFGSLKHKILYLRADKIISSFANFQEYSPFPNEFEYYRDIVKYDLIYLQHGVLHATALQIYSKEFTPIDKIVISSNFEEENFINKYNYSEEDLIKTGMPRLYNSNEQEIETENRIIFAPSWRNYLVGTMVNRKRRIDKNKFKKSNYFIRIKNFLQNEELLKILKEKNIIIDFKLHPIFEPYKECFLEIESKNINVTIGETDLRKYKAFITDFSSYQFDFVRLQKPIIYFLPDAQEFKAGLNAYSELDLKYEDAFGNLCITEKEIVNEIINLIKNDFKVEPIYKERMEKFFFNLKDGQDKLYETLKNDI